MSNNQLAHGHGPPIMPTHFLGNLKTCANCTYWLGMRTDGYSLYLVRRLFFKRSQSVNDQVLHLIHADAYLRLGFGVMWHAKQMLVCRMSTGYLHEAFWGRGSKVLREARGCKEDLVLCV